jgi:hypothetical protein
VYEGQIKEPEGQSKDNRIIPHGWGRLKFSGHVLDAQFKDGKCNEGTLTR